MAKKKSTKKDVLPVQPSVNIGMVGHVDHGKTTLLEKLSGKWTDTHSEELKRGITIRLGYADVTFYKKKDADDLQAYTTEEKSDDGKTQNEPLRKVSFVDAPGHESLMATMLAGTTIMDGALLLVAANEKCPQPQTREHVMALQIVGIKNVIVIQNKIDLVSEEEAIKNYKQIKAFLKDTPFKNAPIVPISAQHGVGISALIKTIQEVIPSPKYDEKKDPLMLVARSFDINRPGLGPNDIVGGVLGGSVIQGKLKVGQEIEISPGRKITNKGVDKWKPIKTFITGLNSGGQKLEELGPGGSAGIMTSLDPSIVKSDRLMGAVVSPAGKAPPVWHEFSLKTFLLKRVVGASQDIIVDPIKLNEPLMLNVNSAATVGFVSDIKKSQIHLKLRIPVCAFPNSRVTISRNIGNRFRLIGYGEILEKKKSKKK